MTQHGFHRTYRRLVAVVVLLRKATQHAELPLTPVAHIRNLDLRCWFSLVMMNVWRVCNTHNVILWCHGRLLRVKVYTATGCECVDKLTLCFKVRFTSAELAVDDVQTYQLTPLRLLQVAQYGG